MPKKREPGWLEENRLAESYGFTCVQDPARGAGWCLFEKGPWCVWICGEGWVVAKVEKNHFTRHSYHNTLKQALSKTPKGKE